ncbi:hypothetical protein CWI37_0303p0010, partial [Hamiltosporidium tvaerminnensis]
KDIEENKDIKENGKDREEYSKDIEENKDIKENGKDSKEYNKDIEENKDREEYSKDIEENKDIKENGKDREEYSKDIEENKDIKENGKDREEYSKDIEENKDIKENGKDREVYGKDIEENKDIKENGKDSKEYGKDIEENKDREVYGKDIEENMKDIKENGKDRDENRKDIRNTNNSKEYNKNIEENSKDREVYCKDKKHYENIYNTHKSTDNTDTYKNEEKDVFELKKLLNKKLIYQIFKKKADFNRKTENILGILICVSIYDKFINFKKLFEMKTVFVFSCFNPYFYSFLSDNKTLMDFVDYKNNLRDNFVIIRIKKIEGLNKESSGRLVKSVKCNGIVKGCNIGGVNYRSSNIEGVNYIVVMKGVLSICSSESVSNNTITKSVLVAIY